MILGRPLRAMCIVTHVQHCAAKWPHVGCHEGCTWAVTRVARGLPFEGIFLDIYGLKIVQCISIIFRFKISDLTI